jgi:hypothetical protein
MKSPEPCLPPNQKVFNIHRIEKKLFSLLSYKYCGNDTMPLENTVLHYEDQSCDRVVMFLNDAFELGFGYPNEWHMIIRRKSFHKIMRWYLWNWVVFEWFGVRRWLWYKLLHRRVNRDRVMGPIPEENS